MPEAQNHSIATVSFLEVEKTSLRKLVQAMLREQLLPVTRQENNLIFSFPSNKQTLRVDQVVLGSMNRVLQIGKIVLVNNEGFEQEIFNLVDLLKIISSELSNETNHEEWLKLSLELTDHLRNAILSQQHSIEINQKIVEEAKQKNYPSLLDWLQQTTTIADKTLFFEQYIPQGHPFHPCSKTKFGFAEEDVLRFSPEFQKEVQLIVAAIKKDCLHLQTMQTAADYLEWFAQNYPTTWPQWQKALKAQNLTMDDYLPMPMHPWQAEKIVPQLFKEQIADKTICILNDVNICTTPTLSFRTLAPTIDKLGAYIKLPVAVQATSLFRTLPDAAVENTPKLSRLFQEIFNREHNFSDKLQMLYEPFGLYFANVTHEKSEHLSVTYRENVHTKLKNDEICIVVAALTQISPITNMPLFIEILHKAKVTQLSQAFTYFQQYVETVLGGYLDLYLKYGIALEGHQQNTLAVFNKEGQFLRCIARDIDGVDIDLETLKQRKLDNLFDLSQTSYVKSRANIRLRVMHTIYQSHLGELVLLLAANFNCNENLFWQIIQKVTQERLMQLKNIMPVEVWQQEYNAFLVDKWFCKGLLRMRLLKESRQEGLFFEVDNPLAN